MVKREYRYVSELRAADGDSMALIGYAALFNKRSHNLGGFVEVIHPGAFQRSLQEGGDVKCLFNHSPSNILGRKKNGTLTVDTDERGLKFRCDLNPDDAEARSLHARVKRGDVDECSFAFTVADGGQDWADGLDTDGSYVAVRTLKDVNLLDVSAVVYPAYPGTNVGARNLFPDGIPTEVRSMQIKNSKKEFRAEESIEDFLRKVSIALTEKFPSTDEQEKLCYPGGRFWMQQTFEDSIIVCECGTGNYFRISYHVDDTNPDNVLFGEPQAVEQEWVPSERTKANVAELRGKADAMIAAHKEAAAKAQTDADAHTQAAADLKKVADERKKRCMDMAGDCDDEACDCQNRMSSDDEIWDEDDDDSDERKARLAAETRDGAGKARTKSVDGKNLTKDKFAFVGDPDKTETWKLPIHDADHARNALARFGQTEGIPAEKKAGVFRKIKAAAKKFGIEVSDDDTKRALATAPLDAEEVWQIKARLTLAMNQ